MDNQKEKPRKGLLSKRSLGHKIIAIANHGSAMISPKRLDKARALLGRMGLVKKKVSIKGRTKKAIRWVRASQEPVAEDRRSSVTSSRKKKRGKKNKQKPSGAIASAMPKEIQKIKSPTKDDLIYTGDRFLRQFMSPELEDTLQEMRETQVGMSIYGFYSGNNYHPEILDMLKGERDNSKMIDNLLERYRKRDLSIEDFNEFYEKHLDHKKLAREGFAFDKMVETLRQEGLNENQVSHLLDQTQLFIEPIGQDTKSHENNIDIVKQSFSDCLKIAGKGLLSGYGDIRIKYIRSDFKTDASGYASFEKFRMGLGRSWHTTNDDDKRRVIFHETGHFFEYGDESTLIASATFIEDRSGGLAFPIKGRKGEYGLDHFADEYTGRTYTGKDGYVNATEVISTGMEALSSKKEAIELITKDPEHFSLVLGAIRNA